MKKIKKLLCLGLAVLLMLCCMTACGNDNSGIPKKNIGITVNGVAYSLEQCNLYFIQSYYDFLDYYGSSVSSLGLDTSKGISGLAEQSCGYDSANTWYDYFLEFSLDRISQSQALCDYAAANGISLTDEETASIDAAMEQIQALAEKEGFASADACLENYYGSGVTAEMYRVYLEKQYLAKKTYYAYVDSLVLTDEEIAAHYLEMGYSADENRYAVTNMRHILILAKADENGEYSEEAILEAHEKAREILSLWQQGEQTEESFAAMAEEYSEDPGSNTAGGLYSTVYQGKMVSGIDTWLFEEGRQEGDTALIDNNGSYVGTHVLYFAGYGEQYAKLIAESDLRDTTIDDWYNNINADYIVKEGKAYGKIGVIESK